MWSAIPNMFLHTGVKVKKGFWLLPCENIFTLYLSIAKLNAAKFTNLSKPQNLNAAKFNFDLINREIKMSAKSKYCEI